MTLIIGLIVLGLVLVSFEIIVPGGLLGFLGAVSIIAACVLAYQDYGMLGALGLFIGTGVLTVIMLVLELKFVPRTKIGQKMFLGESVESQSTHTLGDEELEGKEGEALTTLTPTGQVLVEGNQYEGFSKDGLIPKGGKITVVGRDNFRILVKKSK